MGRFRALIVLQLLALSLTANAATLKLPWSCPASFMITQDGSGCGWDGCSTCVTIGDHGNIPGSLDFGIPSNTELVASAAGTVAYVWMPTQPGDPCYAGSLSCCGVSKSNYIVIDHGDGQSTLYMHINQALVGVGTAVSQGQPIALSGSTGCSTGPHLHFQLQSACGGSWWCPTQWPTFSDWGGSLSYCATVTSGNCGGCTPGCNGDKIVNGDCSENDCGAYASFCSTLGGAPHCISKFCVGSPNETPYDHDTCLLDGNLARCSASGGLEQIACPEGKSCVSGNGSAWCDPPLVPPNGVKRFIPDGPTWESWKFTSTDVFGLPAADITAYPDGPVMPPNPVLLRASGALEVYVIDGEVRRWIPSPTVFDAWRFDNAAIQEVSASELAVYPEAKPWRPAPYLVSPEAYVGYVIDDALDGSSSTGGAGNGTGGAGAGWSGGAGVTGSGSSSASDANDDASGSGCGCRSTKAPATGAWWAFLLAFLARDLRKRSRAKRALG